MKKPKIILVAGPTASGKSAFAHDLAGKIGGTIINADAMQIYDGLPILSAQPDAALQKEIPYVLYGTMDPAKRSSAGKWLALVRPAIIDVVKAGRVPILVGGTGLYFKALLGGLSDIPEIPEEVRAKTQKLYDKIGEEKFRRELSKMDRESAKRIARNDRQRLIRAYEVAKHTGKPLSHWQKSRTNPASPVEFLVENADHEALPKPDDFLKSFVVESFLLMPSREEIYAACDKRFTQMIEQGAVKEVRAFLKRKLEPELPAMKTIGVPEISAHLDGKMSLKGAIAKAQQATRNYAKRQMTWFRNQWDNDE